MLPTLPRLASAPVTGPFKRAQLGLFHGQVRQAGNNKPHSKQKTRRSWLPNIQSKRLQLTTLDEEVKVKLTTKALKTIKKLGSLDAYLLNTKPALLGYEGLRLRSLVNEPHISQCLEKEAVREELRESRLREQEMKVVGRAMLAKREARLRAAAEKAPATEATAAV